MPRGRTLERNQTALERQEEAQARAAAAAYRQARREILDLLLTQWTGTRALTPRDAVELWRRLALLPQIDARLHELEQRLGVVLRDVVTNAGELAVEQILRELAELPPSFRPPVGAFAQIEEMMVEQFVPVAMQEITQIQRSTSMLLQREIQTGLLQGQSFPDLVRRLMAATPSGEGPAVWRNGELSAERMVRRTVITANNAAKQEAIRQTNRTAQVDSERVQKQAVASVGPRTTQTCLRVHGQIQPVDGLFELTGEPRFARRMAHPAFHWNCRTSVAMYHPFFERGGLTTANMRSSAAAELRRRDGGG